MNPKEKYKLFAENKNFCVVPWTGIEINSDGEVMTCAQGATTLGNIQEQSLEEVLNAKPIKDIKKNMLANKPDANCFRCTRRQIHDKNFTYLRDHYNKLLVKDDVNYNDIDEFKLHTVDLHWSNVCNLRCIMCNPKQSSLVAKDDGVFIKPIEEQNIQTIIKTVVENQYNMREVYLSGGEPFYIPYNIELMKRIENKDIPLRINTNMQWNKNNRLFQVLKDFTNVHITVSADAVSDKFEYIRNGASWSDFIDNIDYVRQNTTFKIRMNTIFSIMNADTIPDLIMHFYNELDIKDITINLLLKPKEMDARNYPSHKKGALIKKLESLLTLATDNKNLSSNIENCIMQLNLPNQHEYNDALDHYTRKHKQDWREVFVDLV